MSFKSLTLAAVLLLGVAGCSVSSSPAAPDTVSQVSAEAGVDAFPDAEPFANVLSKYVNEQNFVDYKTLQTDRAELDSYNASLAPVSQATYDSWSEPEQIAYWINAYNSLTLASIVDQEPIKDSIRDIPGVWKRRQHPILSQEKTLDNIEHATLRKDFNEPRIHAALVCAAVSCPPLRNEPYTAAQLDEQLDDQVRQWLSRPGGFRIDREEGRVYISSIFKWFGEDWVPTYGTDKGFAGSNNERAVLNFISQYVSEDEKAYLEAGDYKVKYEKYDWSLNDTNASL